MMSRPGERTKRETATANLVLDEADRPASESAVRADPAALETTAHIVTFKRRQGENAMATPSRSEGLPDRYDVRESGSGRYLRCLEAPGVGVAVDLSYGFSETEARKLGERTVLLDGAGQFGPLIDSTRQLYNLDHHASCLRAFTLATCEQAMVLVAKGLELDQGDWTVCANEPDLDTVFAIWVLLNYRRIREMESHARDAFATLVRLEGAIDANGFEVAEFCGLPHDTLVQAREQLDRLHGRELAAKRLGSWEGVDLLDFVRGQLIEIDRLVYRPEDLGDLARVEEDLGHVGIGKGRVAVICSDGGGIYDVEKRLKKVWGDRLGIIVLAKSDRHYTLRRVAALADIDLERAYHRLNQLDRAVDGHPSEKRWGGSDEIGGSPRPSGSHLDPNEIIECLRLAYCASPIAQRLRRMTNALGVAAAAAGSFAASRWLAGEVLPPSLLEGPACLTLVGVLAAMIAAVIGAGWIARGRTWQLGWRWPAGEEWLLALPVILAGSALGGVWIPSSFDWTPRGLASALGAMTSLSVAAGLWFFGIAHGYLMRSEPIQVYKGRWFLSMPAVLAAAGYAVVTVAGTYVWGLPDTTLLGDMGAIATWGVAIVGALLVGVGAALARERSMSTLPVVLALVLGGILRVVLLRLG